LGLRASNGSGCSPYAASAKDAACSYSDPAKGVAAGDSAISGCWSRVAASEVCDDSWRCKLASYFCISGNRSLGLCAA